MRESRSYGSVRGALRNERPYRDRKIGCPWELLFYAFFCARWDDSAWAVGRGRVERMMGPGDVYRLRATDMFAQAARNLRALAMAFLRLAEEADRNAQRVCRWTQMIPAAHRQRQQQPPQAAAATDSGAKAPSAGER
jgi:hypothetical protein